MAIFQVTGPFPTGTNPVSEAIADLNGDGNLDLLHTNYISDNVSILLGDGAGGFTAGTPVPVTNGPREILVGDLDGDGDFVATNYAGNNVTVALNNGSGAFTTSSVAVGSVPRGIGMADLDGDGDLDFISANYQGNSLSVMLNNGSGVFSQASGSPLATGGTRPVDVATGDFDGDGDVDIATSNNSTNNVGVLLNNGDGTFAAAVTYATGAGPRGMTTGDVDGDGFKDIVVVNFSAGSVAVLKNNGNGTFAAPVNFATANNPYDVRLGDLDGDGDLDMVVSNSGSSSISVLLNDGTGSFTSGNGAPFAVGVSPGGVSLGDFDEDGDLDIATSNFGSNTASILINKMATYSVTAVSDTEGTGTGNGGELVFTITRTATSEAEDVTFSLGGTATSGTDYVAPGSLTVSFAAGQDAVEVHIAIKPDGLHEGNETVILTLTDTSGEGTFTATGGTATGLINNDDLLDVLGSTGNDTLVGTGVDERLIGRGGTDVLRGGGGNDLLIAGHGVDRLQGGAGEDTFIFSSLRASGFGIGGTGGDDMSNPNLGVGKRDVILDFTKGEDIIDLRRMDADSTANGNQAFVWKGKGNFSGNAGELVYRIHDEAGTAKDRTVIYGDVNHDGRADFQIELVGAITLTKSDFFL